ncbi:TPA: hypothetical protein DCZ36_03835 [Candidatus Gracilibacteria bacterium]|nr:hypothetical protein [Candidatus Gracilibacteria bacterium]
MNKRYRIALLLIILILGGLFLFFYKVRDIDFSSDFYTRFFMRNLTWQTDFRTSVPYKKGDIVEYTWIFSGNSPRNIAFDIFPLKNFLDIERIEFDDREIQEKDLGNIHIRDSSLLKITGKAKNTSTDNAVIQPKITTTEETDREDKSIEEKEKLVSIPQTEPTDITLDITGYNSNINNLVTLRGKNLDSIEFVNIGEKRIRPVYSSGALFVQIDRDTFQSGEYFVFFTLKNGKILTSEHRLSFEYSSSAINIANITPKTIQNNEDRFVVIQGNGFDKIVSIQLSNNLVLKNAEFNIINNQVAGVKIPKGLPSGEYYFNIMDTVTIYELKNMKFTITN